MTIKTCFEREREGECCHQPFLHECLLCCCYRDVVILSPCAWCNVLLGHSVYHHGTADVSTRKGTAAVNEKIAVGLVLLIDSLIENANVGGLLTASFYCCSP